ncbi:hypothetical protein BASA81_005787 [Batrachochytrium salamandrivorans]|nr:hypothetical protein BASA81_005787 [Batrachochytrium salamandrivorans]
MRLAATWFFAAVLGLGWLAYQQHDRLIECNNPLVSTQAECYYSINWLQARHLFLHHAKRAGAELVELEIGKDLVIDVAVLLPHQSSPYNPEDLVIHISGTHGVEGFAGSAIQSAFLHRVSLGLQPINKTMVLVHGLNPFGMQNYRRANEHNVDLNRNIRFKGDFNELTNRDPNIAGYETFKHVLNPQRAPGWKSNLQLIVDAMKIAYQHGMDGAHLFKRAFVTGTYTNPTGPFFGGREMQPSHLALGKFLTERGFIHRKRVVFVDVHTGLGPFAKDTLLVSHNVDQVHKQYGGEKSREPYKIEHQGGSNVEGAAKGYDLVDTDAQTAYGKLFDSQPMISITQEIGTVPSVMAAWALIQENQAWFHGTPHDKRSGGERLKHAFSPHSQSFAEKIIKRGLIVLEQSLL